MFERMPKKAWAGKEEWYGDIRVEELK